MIQPRPLPPGFFERSPLDAPKSEAAAIWRDFYQRTSARWAWSDRNPMPRIVLFPHIEQLRRAIRAHTIPARRRLADWIEP